MAITRDRTTPKFNLVPGIIIGNQVDVGIMDVCGLKELGSFSGPVVNQLIMKIATKLSTTVGNISLIPNLTLMIRGIASHAAPLRKAASAIRGIEMPLGKPPIWEETM